MILSYMWFPYPVTFAAAACVTAVSLYLNALRQRYTPGGRAGFAGGGILVFLVPALAFFLGSDVGCNSDTGSSWRSSTPTSLLLCLSGAGLLGLVALLVASRPAGRGWLLPIGVAAIMFTGFFTEIFLALVVLEGYCRNQNPMILYLPLALAALVSTVVVVLMSRTGGTVGEFVTNDTGPGDRVPPC